MSTKPGPLYLCSSGTLYTRYAGMRHPIIPNTGLQIEVKLRTGALIRMAPHDTRIAKTRIHQPTSFSLIRSEGIIRCNTFIAIPLQASRNPKKTPK